MPNREIPSEDQERINAFLRDEEKKANSRKREGLRDGERRQLESNQSGKLLTPQEAITLAESYGATIRYGKGDHCYIQFEKKEVMITLRPREKTLDPGTCKDLRKLLRILRHVSQSDKITPWQEKQ